MGLKEFTSFSTTPYNLYDKNVFLTQESIGRNDPKNGGSKPRKRKMITQEHLVPIQEREENRSIRMMEMKKKSQDGR